MTDYQRKIRQQLTIWITCVLLSFGLIGWVMYTLTSAQLDRAHALTTTAAVLKQRCLEDVTTLGFRSTQTDDLLHLTYTADPTDPLALLAHAQFAQLACPGFAVSTLCAGADCARAPLEMTLTLSVTP